MQKFILLGLLPSLALAGRISSPFVLRRTEGGGGYDTETCEDLGMQDCGGCIPLDYTCCPSKTGGCPSDQRCVVGDNGEDGCCPVGSTCTGNGGVSSTTFSLTATTSTPVETPSPTPTDGAGEENPPDYSEEIPGPTLVDPDPEETPTPTPQPSPEPTPEPSPEPTSSEEAEPTETSTEEAAESTTTESASASETETASEEATTTTASEETTTASEEETTSTPAASLSIPYGNSTTTAPPTLSTSLTRSFSNGTFTTASTTAYTTSTVYTTTTKTITSCPASHPCQSGTGVGEVIVVTETIAVSTTICPVTELPPTPTVTPTVTPPVIGGGPTTTIAPVNPPVVICPGNNQPCSPIDNGGDDSDSDSDDDEEETPQPSAIIPPSYSHGAPHPTGTGVLPKPPMTTGHVPVTGGAARAVGRAMGGVVGVLGFAVVFL